MVNAVLYALNHTRSLMFCVSCHAGKYVKGPMHVDRSGTPVITICFVSLVSVSMECTLRHMFWFQFLGIMVSHL
jgi:hypothetical protein